jgi:hypothetical protein
MSIFKKFSWHSAAIYVPIDYPIHRTQIELVTTEFEEIKQNTVDKSQLFFFKYWDSINTDSYGSFVFLFDEDVLSLKREEQEKINTSLTELFWDTEWATKWHFWHSLSDGDIELVEKDDFEEFDYFNEYVDSQIASGYTVNINDLYEVFSGHLSQSDIDKKLTFKIISNPESFTKT